LKWWLLEPHESCSWWLLREIADIIGGGLSRAELKVVELGFGN